MGIDVVPVQRFATALARTPAMAAKLFTEHERSHDDGRPRSPDSLAGRFAVKEALAKALGAPGGMAWTDAEVSTAASGQPRLNVTGTVAACADALGVTSWHVSLSHDGGMAAAVVIAERG